MSYVSGIRIYKIVNLSLLTKIISFVKKYFCFCFCVVFVEQYFRNILALFKDLDF